MFSSRLSVAKGGFDRTYGLSNPVSQSSWEYHSHMSIDWQFGCKMATPLSSKYCDHLSSHICLHMARRTDVRIVTARVSITWVEEEIIDGWWCRIDRGY